MRRRTASFTMEDLSHAMVRALRFANLHDASGGWVRLCTLHRGEGVEPCGELWISCHEGVEPCGDHALEAVEPCGDDAHEEPVAVKAESQTRSVGNFHIGLVAHAPRLIPPRCEETSSRCSWSDALFHGGEVQVSSSVDTGAISGNSSAEHSSVPSRPFTSAESLCEHWRHDLPSAAKSLCGATKCR